MEQHIQTCVWTAAIRMMPSRNEAQTHLLCGQQPPELRPRAQKSKENANCGYLSTTAQCAAFQFVSSVCHIIRAPTFYYSMAASKKKIENVCLSQQSKHEQPTVAHFAEVSSASQVYFCAGVACWLDLKTQRSLGLDK